MNLSMAIILSTLLIPVADHKQNRAADLQPEQHFNFWIGEWDVSWHDEDGNAASGRNLIRRILNDRVIEENFSVLSGRYESYSGRSWSVFDDGLGEWKQTWVDNNGAYLDFTGAIDEDKRIFQRVGKDNHGKTVHQRMVFYDIGDDSFTWDWQVSIDGGASWELRWRIFYNRAK